MRKKSIFSHDYREHVRRKRINIILVILILICGAFFGGKYYLDRHSIDFLNINKLTGSLSDKNKTNKDNSQKDKTGTNTANTNQNTNGQQGSKNTEKYYEYKTADGKVYKIGYTDLNGSKEIVDFKDATNTADFDISKDKQMAVFDDKSSGEIITVDVNGNFKEINPTTYQSKSAGITIEMKSTLSARPWYVWAQKPYFTSDGRVAFISNLPYLIKGKNLFLWTTDLNGSNYRMVGQLSTNINNISYEGYDSTGGLKINSDGTTYYLEPGSFKLTK